MEEGELSDRTESAPVDQELSSPADSRDREDEWVPRHVLPVAPMDAAFNPNAEPETGEEYLRLVRHHDAQLPFALAIPSSDLARDYCTAPRDPILDNPVEQMARETDPAHLPTADWIARFIESFEACTGAAQIPPLADATFDVDWPPFGNVAAWKALLYPSSEAASDDEPDAKRPCVAPPVAIHPDTFLIASPSQRQLMQLLKYHHQTWINPDVGLTPLQYHWIFRILQVLDQRVTSNQAANLRQLALFCMRLRRDQAPTAQEQVAHLNGIIAIVAKVFGQADLLL